MKRTLFLSLVTALSAASLHAADYTLRNGVDYAPTYTANAGCALQDVATTSETRYAIKSNVACWTNNSAAANELLGLYLADGAGVKFNHSQNVKVTYLYLGEGIAFQTGTGCVPGAVNWSSAGHKLIMRETEGAFVDINSDVAANINVGGMNNGNIYLNTKGYIDTTGAVLGASNTVHATYSKELSPHATETVKSLLPQQKGSVISVGTTVKRTLLAGDYSTWGGDNENWADHVVLSGFAEGATVNRSASGLSVTYGDTHDYATRNGEDFVATKVMAGSAELTTDAQLNESYLVLRSANGNSTWANRLDNIEGLYLADGAGIKFNHSQTVTVTHLHIGDNIVFQNGTDNVAGAINWSTDAGKFAISSAEGAYVDIDSDVGGKIDVHSMDNGSVYLNGNGFINTVDAVLGASNTVYASFREGAAAAHTAAAPDALGQSGSNSVIRVNHYKARTLLSGNYSDWAGTVVLDEGYISREGVATAGANGLSVSYAVSYTDYTTRNGEDFVATKLVTDDSRLSDDSDTTSGESYFITKSANGKSTWTNRLDNIEGLYLADGAGIKFNHDRTVTVKYLHIGDNIVFQSQTGNVAGGINWYTESARMAVSGEDGAYADLNFDAQDKLRVNSMNNGNVYLNVNGHIDTTDATLGGSNTVHASYGDTSNGHVVRNVAGFVQDADDRAHVTVKFDKTRTLLTGDYSDWAGTVVLDEGYQSRGAAVAANAGGLSVSYFSDQLELATRNGEDYAVTAVLMDSNQITDGDQRYLILRAANGNSAWTNSAAGMEGLYIADGAGIKFNHAEGVAITYLHVGDNVVFQSSSNNVAGGINWSSGAGRFVVNGTEGAYVDINVDAGRHINLGNMDNGDVYLNRKGHIISQLGDSNTVHATVLAEGSLKRDFVDEDGHLVWTYNTRTLLTGNYEDWAGTLDLTDANGNRLEEGTYAVLATGSALRVACCVTESGVYAGESGVTTAHGLFADEAGVALGNLGDVTFADNRATTLGDAFAGAVVLASDGDISLVSDGNVVFARNVAADYSSIGGAIYSGGFGSTASVEAASLQMDSNHSDLCGGAVGAAFGEVSLSTTGGDMVLSDNTAAGDGGAVGADTVVLSSAAAIRLTGNSSESNGGAVSAESMASLTAADGIQLSGNNGGYGGAIYSSFGSVELTAEGGDISLTGNAADSDGGAICASSSVALTATGSIIADNNSALCGGGAIYTDDTVEVVAAGAITLSNNTADYDGGAIYGAAGVSLTAGTGMEITGNSADNGGAIAIDSGAVSLGSTEGAITVGNNTAAGLGGAIYAAGDDAEVSLSAMGGNMTFSDNTDSTGGNDITFASTGVLNLIAGEGCTLTLNSGVNGAEGAVEIAVNAGGETGTVVLGGTSDLVHHTTVGGGKLVLMEGAVLGRESAAGGEPGILNLAGGSESSTLVVNGGELSAETQGTATIYADSVSISDATVKGVTINLNTDEMVEITNSTLTATAIVADNVTLADSTLTETTVTAAGAAANLVLDGTTVVLTDLADTANVFEGFSTVTGTVTVDISLEALKAAAGSEISINLFDNDVTVDAAGGLNLQFSQTLANILTDAKADFGFVEADDTLIPEQELLGGFTNGKFTIDLTQVEEDALVPEPATSTLSLLALAALCARRRRKAC